MSENSKKLYQGHISQDIAQNKYCGSPDGEVMFVAPIDLLPDDVIFIDSASGRPLAVYREGRKIWQFEGEYITGSATFSATIDTDAWAYLIERLKP